MKNIVIITTSYPKSENQQGSEAAGAFVKDFAEELSIKRQVIVMAPSSTKGGYLKDGFSDSIGGHRDISCYYYWAPDKPLVGLNPINPIHFFMIIRVLLSGFRVVKKIAQENQVDFVFALWALPSGLWAKRLATLANVKSGALEHQVPQYRARKYGTTRYGTWALGSDIWKLGKIPGVRKLLKYILKKSVVNFADGFQLAKEVEKITNKPCQFLASTRKITTTEKVSAKKAPYNLGFVGRWHHNKGVDLLMDALKLLDEADYSKIASIKILGGGDLETKLQKEVAVLQAKGLPIELGTYVNKKEVETFLSDIDFLLLPSRIESIPVIFSDAVKSACPIIATPVGDLPYLLTDYDFGVMADDVTAESFSLVLKKILREDQQEFYNNRDKLLTLFDLPSVVDNFLNAIPATKKL